MITLVSRPKQQLRKRMQYSVCLFCACYPKESTKIWFSSILFVFVILDVLNYILIKAQPIKDIYSYDSRLGKKTKGIQIIVKLNRKDASIGVFLHSSLKEKKQASYEFVILITYQHIRPLKTPPNVLSVSWRWAEKLRH